MSLSDFSDHVALGSIADVRSRKSHREFGGWTRTLCRVRTEMICATLEGMIGLKAMAMVMLGQPHELAGLMAMVMMAGCGGIPPSTE